MLVSLWGPSCGRTLSTQHFLQPPHTMKLGREEIGRADQVPVGPKSHPRVTLRSLAVTCSSAPALGEGQSCGRAPPTGCNDSFLNLTWVL